MIGRGEGHHEKDRSRQYDKTETQHDGLCRVRCQVADVCVKLVDAHEDFEDNEKAYHKDYFRRYAVSGVGTYEEEMKFGIDEDEHECQDKGRLKGGFLDERKLLPGLEKFDHEFEDKEHRNDDVQNMAGKHRDRSFM